jgi:hypothetical protein
MPVTVSDICRDADLFRRAYPSWPQPEPDRDEPEPLHIGAQTDAELVREERWAEACS